MDVTFMTAEKWVVPAPIQYELLSLPQYTDYDKFPIAGIHLDPRFACLQTKLLCYHSMGNINGTAEMLTLMNHKQIELAYSFQRPEDVLF